MQQRSLSCWQCGAVVSSEGGRCPACGAEQPPAAMSSRSARPHRERTTSDLDRGTTPSSSSLLWVALIAVAAAIGAAVFLLRTRNASSDADRRPPVALPVEGE